MGRVAYFTPLWNETEGRWEQDTTAFFMTKRPKETSRREVVRVGPIAPSSLTNGLGDECLVSYEADGKSLCLWHIVGLPECRECGKPFDALSCGDGPRMVEQQLCFTCLFWTDHLEKGDKDGRRVIVYGHHYKIGSEAPSYNRGFGGQKFTIRFLVDGETIVTTNLWHQGAIPAHFRDRLPDNAEFVKGGS